MDVLRHFENDSGDPKALISISSSIIEWGGTIVLSTTPDYLIQQIASTQTYNADTPHYLEIPTVFAHTQLFYFTYIAPDECVYQDNFGLIPSCSDNAGDSFNFHLDHNGDELQTCGEGQTNTYEFDVYNHGNNYPYFIEVTMENAYNDTELQYTHLEIIEDDFDNPITISGIPSGKVAFRVFNNCADGDFNIKKHTNCCVSSPCGLEDSFETSDFGESYRYDFQYFSISTIGSGDCFANGESNIIISNGSPVGTGKIFPYIRDRCWTGNIRIDYDWGGSNDDFCFLEVIDDGTQYNKVHWTDGDNNWHPPHEGSYTIHISYEGTGDNEGVDCEEELNYEFFGATNYKKAIGFVNDWWYDFNGRTEEFDDAYYATWTCDVCTNDDTPYIYDNNHGECDTDNINPNPSFFIYFPNDFDDPCTLGGVLTKIDFDGNGNPVSQTVTIPAGKSVGEIEGIRPIWLEADQWCYESGWCLFESIDVYGFDFPDGRRIVGSWANYLTCEPIPIVDSPDPEVQPCDPDNNPCPPGYTCEEGNCIEGCNDDGDCLVGTCEDGLCIEEEIIESNNCDFDEFGVETDCTDCGFEINVGECSANLVCYDNDEILLENVPSITSFCIQSIGEGTAYRVVSFCSDDVCNSEVEVISGEYSSVSAVYESTDFAWVANLSVCPTCIQGFTGGLEDNTSSLINQSNNSASIGAVNQSKVLVGNTNEGLPNLKIYPNPGRELIHIQVSDIKQEVVKVSMKSVLANEMIVMEYGNRQSSTDDIITIPISNISKGLYLISVEFDDGSVQTQKWVKI